MYSQTQKALSILLLTSMLLQSCGTNLMLGHQRSAMREQPPASPYQAPLPNATPTLAPKPSEAADSLPKALAPPPYTARSAWKAQQQRRGRPLPLDCPGKLLGGGDSEDEGAQEEAQRGAGEHKASPSPARGASSKRGARTARLRSTSPRAPQRALLAANTGKAKAIAHFQGEDAAGSDLRQYQHWYDPTTLEYLASTLGAAAQSHALKIVLHECNPLDPQTSFVEQVKQLKLLRNSTGKQTVLFISKEPGAGAHHFLFWILHEHILILFNPVGKSMHADLAAGLSAVKEQGLAREIYVSSTQIQRDTTGLVSCGPICAELLLHYGAMDQVAFAQTMRSLLRASKAPRGSHRPYDKEVEVSHFLPPSLYRLLEMRGNYPKRVTILRESHLRRLEHAASSLREERPEQVCFNLLMTEAGGFLALEQSEAYRQLQGLGAGTRALAGASQPTEETPLQEERVGAAAEEKASGPPPTIQEAEAALPREGSASARSDLTLSPSASPQVQRPYLHFAERSRHSLSSGEETVTKQYDGEDDEEEKDVRASTSPTCRPSTWQRTQKRIEALKQHISEQIESLHKAPRADPALVASLLQHLDRLLQEEKVSEPGVSAMGAQALLSSLRRDLAFKLTEAHQKELLKLQEDICAHELIQLMAPLAAPSDRSLRLVRVLGDLAGLHKERGDAQDDQNLKLAYYTDEATLYQHVLTVCEKERKTAQERKSSYFQGLPTHEQEAYEGLAQVKAKMLTQIQGAAVPSHVAALQEEIDQDKMILDDLRKQASEKIKRLAELEMRYDKTATYVEGTQVLFEDLAEGMRGFVERLYQESEVAMGRPAPCRYAVMGMGSMALKQITPYSDLELAILIEENADEAAKTYLRNLSHLVNLRLVNLGESVIPTSRYGVDFAPIGKKGVNFDLGGKTPLGRKDRAYDLIQTVEGMMRYLQNEGGVVEGIDKLLPFILECTCLVHGDTGLYGRYESAKKTFLARPEVHQARAKKMLVSGSGVATEPESGLKTSLQGALKAFAPKLDSDHMGQMYDVKQEIYRLPDRLLYQLALYHGLLARSGWDAVTKLAERRVINEVAAQHLHYATSFAVLLRLRAYAHYGYQQEMMITLSPVASQQEREQALTELFRPFPTVLQEDGSLFRYYYTTLPLREQMVQFFEQEPRENAFCIDADFYDTSPMVKGVIHERLLRYASAKACYQQALESYGADYLERPNPLLVSTLDSLGRAHEALGEERLALERRQEALTLCRALYGDHALEVAKADMSVGKSYTASGRAGKALECFQKALRIVETLDEQQRCAPAVLARCLSHVGQCYHSLGEKEQALSSFEKSLTRYQAICKDQAHWALGRAHDNLGLACEALGETEKSLACKRKGLEMTEALYPGQNHPHVAHCLHSVGCAYEALNEASQGIGYKERALLMLRALHPTRHHTQLALWLDSVGSSYCAIGEKQKGLAHKREGLRMLKALYGSQEHLYVARALCSVGSTCVEMRQTREGLGLLQESLEQLQKLHQGRLHRDLVDCYDSLATGYESLGRSYWAQAQQYRDKASKMRRGLHDESPESLQQQLQAHYCTSYAHLPPLFEEKEEHSQRGQPMEIVRFTLMLNQQRKVKEKTKEEEEKKKQQDQIADRAERLEHVKTHIALEDLFKRRGVVEGEPEKEVQRVLLVGDPGTGKTTVTRKLAYAWAHQQWDPAFAAVYVLPVRALQEQKYNGTGLYSEKTLQTAIANICFPTVREEEAYNQLRMQIVESLKESSTLVVLDGLDERSGASEELLEQAKAGQHKLLMLSRPYGLAQARLLADIEIEHTGLSDGQMQAYLDWSFERAPDKGQGLLSFLKERPAMEEMAHVPVNLNILCTLWERSEARVQEAGHSLTKLYEILTDYAWDRYLHKEVAREEEIDAKRDKVFTALGMIALEGLKRGQLLVAREVIEDALRDLRAGRKHMEELLRGSGLLLLTRVDEQGMQYQFPHLTFQEYFAGRELARQLCSQEEDEREEAQEFLSAHKYSGKYERMLTFLSGELSKGRGRRGLRGISELLGWLNREESREVTGLHHLFLQLRSVEAWLSSPGRRLADLTEYNESLERTLVGWLEAGLACVRKNREDGALLRYLTGSLPSIRTVVGEMPAVLELLVRAAGDNNWSVHSAAIAALGELVRAAPQHAEAVLAALIQAARDSDADVRRAASVASEELLQAAPQYAEAALANLIQAAQDSDWRVSSTASTALGKILNAAPHFANEAVLAALIQAVRNTDWRVSRAAGAALGELLQIDPQHAEAALANLIQDVQDSDADVRSAASQALSQLVKVAPHFANEAVSAALMQASRDSDAEVRRAASAALGELLQAAPHFANEIVLAALIQAVRDSDWRVRSSASAALGELSRAAPQHAEAVLAALLQAAVQDSDTDVRIAAIEALGELLQAVPQYAEVVLAALIQDARDADPEVRRAASAALGKTVGAAPHFASEAVLAALIQDARDSDWRVRRAASTALGELLGAAPQHVEPALTALIQAARDADWRVSSTASAALGELVRAASHFANEAVLAVLTQAARDSDWRVSSIASTALGELLKAAPQHAEAVLAALTKAAQDSDWRVSSHTSASLGSISWLQLIQAGMNAHDQKLISFIARKLYATPLVIHQSRQGGYQQLVLYPSAGQPEVVGEWPQADVERFVQAIRGSSAPQAQDQEVKQEG